LPASCANDNKSNLATTIIITDNITKKIKVIIYGGENTAATNNAIPPEY
jgi:hypothetical protein